MFNCGIKRLETARWCEFFTF